MSRFCPSPRERQSRRVEKNGTATGLRGNKNDLTYRASLNSFTVKKGLAANAIDTSESTKLAR